MTTIDIGGGVRIACTDTGPPPERPDAATIVFGHGLLFGGWMFRPQIEVLRRRYRCVALDWRGQGDTPATRGGYDMDTLTADAAALIRTLGVSPVHWVGLSMGGFVGQRLAARHAGLLRSLTLLDTSAGPEEPENARTNRVLAEVYRAVGIGPISGRVARALFGPEFLAGPDAAAVIDEWVTRLRRCDRSGVRRAVLAVADRSPVEHELAAITVPTLVVVGADDTATPPARSEHIAAAVPGARLHVLAGCGHTSTLEQPAAVTALVEGFLTAVEKDPAGSEEVMR